MFTRNEIQPVTDIQPVITVRKQSCGKVMFSQACVKNSVHREGEVYTPWADTPRADTLPPSPQTSTAADGTHPTGILEFVLTVPTSGTRCAREICMNKELCDVFSLQSSYDKRRWL